MVRAIFSAVTVHERSVLSTLERGVIMDGDKPEHLLEAIPVMGCYCDVIGVRSFARFESKADDYELFSPKCL